MKATVDESVTAWEKRGYWLKSERFLRDWEWIPELAANIEDVVRHQAWDLLPELMGELSHPLRRHQDQDLHAQA